MRKLVTTLMLALLLGCASTPQSAQQSVYAAKQSYAIALTVAVAYKQLPACGPRAPGLCSEPKIVATLQKVDVASSALLDAAEHVVRTEGAGPNVNTALKAANEAVQAFVTITTALRVK